MKSRAFSIISILSLLLCVSAEGGGIVDETTEQVYSIGANPSLTLRNTDGRVFIYGSEDNEIKVKVYKRAFTQERLAKIEANITVTGNAMRIDTIYPPAEEGLFADRSGTVEYTILVPQSCTISQLELAQGEIQIEGLRGPGIDAHLGNGRITLRNCFTPTRVALGSGGIDVLYTWWEALPFSLSLEAEKGDMTLHLAPNTALQLEAATGSGHIRNHFVDDEEHADVETLQTAIGDGSEIAFKLHTLNGNIKIERAY